jgi:cellulose biosynthesis protein BcsQ
MSEVTKSAIAASHYVIAPILPSPYALSGFNHLQQSVVSMQGLMGRGVYLLGCVLTQWTGNDQEAVEKLRAQLTTQDVSLFGPVRRAQSWKIEDTLKTYKSAVKQIVRRIATL